MAEPTSPQGSDQSNDAGTAGSSGSTDATADGRAAPGAAAPAETARIDATGAVATDATGPVDDGVSPDVAAAEGAATEPVPADATTPPTTTPPTTTPPTWPESGEPVQPSDGEGADGLGGSEDGGSEDGDFEEDEPARKGGLLTRQVQVDARMILIITAVLAIGAGAYVLGQKQARDASRPPAATSTPAPPSTSFTVPKDFVPFDDKETGIQLAVPKDWVAYSTRDLDRSYRLLVGVPDAKDNLRVRMNAYSQAVTKENIGDQQAVVDAIFAEEKIEILARETPTVNGLPALYYVYKFTDADGAPGYHAHFFVFQGRKMVSLVFEAVPEARFAVLAPVFDQIANSLRVAPGEPPAFLQEATGTGATVPPATIDPGATPTSTPPSSTP